MPWAVIVFAILATQATETAGRRHRGEAHAIGSRLPEPRKRHNSAVGRLDERAFRERAAASWAALYSHAAATRSTRVQLRDGSGRARHRTRCRSS